VDPKALKVRRLEKLFKKSQGVKSIPDIENGYTDTLVTLPDRFKMPHIDRFDGSRDPMVHLQLFSDILRPMTTEAFFIRPNPFGCGGHLVRKTGRRC